MNPRVVASLSYTNLALARKIKKLASNYPEFNILMVKMKQKKDQFSQ